MSAIEQELLKATGLKKKKAEKTQDYYSRLANAVQDLSDDAWTKLSNGAQLWTNAAAKASNKDAEIEAFPDIDDDAGGGEEEAPEKPAAAATSDKPAAAKKNGKAAKDKEEAAAPAAPKKADKPATGTGRPPISVAIKRIILDKMDITAKEISDVLLKRGYSKISEFTIVTIRSDFRNSLKVLKEQGLIDIEI